jgi:hypothetical protein
LVSRRFRVRQQNQQKRYYVYTLSYPGGYTDANGTDLSGVVFYVGKGSTNERKIDRMDDHEVYARKGRVGPTPAAIRKIWNQGKQIQKTKVYETGVEVDALMYEWVCIQFIYAGPYLTNISGNRYYQEYKEEARLRMLARMLEEHERERRELRDRTYTVSARAQEVLVSLAHERGLAPQECLEQLILSYDNPDYACH